MEIVVYLGANSEPLCPSCGNAMVGELTIPNTEVDVNWADGEWDIHDNEMPLHLELQCKGCGFKADAQDIRPYILTVEGQ